MNIRGLVASLFTITVTLTSACGSDSEDGKTNQSSSSADKDKNKGKPSSDGAAMSGAAAGNSAAFAGTPAPVACGSVMCSSEGSGVASFLARPCCVDEAKGICGTSPITGGGCAEPVESDSRCPELDVMGFLKLPSCCTAENRCGLNASMFGMPGCVDLKNAATQVPAMGLVMFPQPRTCDGTLDPVETVPADTDADAGV
jgi:hypothetical protein